MYKGNIVKSFNTYLSYHLVYRFDKTWNLSDQNLHICPIIQIHMTLRQVDKIPNNYISTFFSISTLRLPIEEGWEFTKMLFPRHINEIW